MGTTEKRETLKTATDVLEHLLKNGRKIKKSKLYQDIRKGILRRNADLSFSVGNVNKYGTTLPMAETPEMVLRRPRNGSAARTTRTSASRKPRPGARNWPPTSRGQVHPRDMVEQELAAGRSR